MILIVETGEASVRGLSVKTDKFRVFRADDYPTVQTWGWIRKLYPDQVHSEEKAKRAWDRKFEQRKKENCFLLLTGPILYIWAKMLQAQAKCVYLKEKEKIRIYRAVEHDDKEKCSGKEALGILVEWKHRTYLLFQAESTRKSEQVWKDTRESPHSFLSKSKATTNYSKEKRRRGDHRQTRGPEKLRPSHLRGPPVRGQTPQRPRHPTARRSLKSKLGQGLAPFLLILFQFPSLESRISNLESRISRISPSLESLQDLPRAHSKFISLTKGDCSPWVHSCF